MKPEEMGQISDELLALIDRHIQITGESKTLFEPPLEIESKIDLLERIVEVLRIKTRHLENSLPMEQFIQGYLGVDDKLLCYAKPKKYKNLGSGTRPIRLQSKLLLFLLIHHNTRLSVYEIIDNFIQTIWDYLETLDFKRTRTGVIRCFTNTRFAALTLREYGLLEFTEKEAFKTWRLSLLGIIVASKVMEAGNWDLSRSVKELQSYALHPDVREAFRDLQNLDAFVLRLSVLCKPDVGIFTPFRDQLMAAYHSLCSYREIIQDPRLSKEERSQKAYKLMQQLQQDPKIEELYKQLSENLRAGDFVTMSKNWR